MEGHFLLRLSSPNRAVQVCSKFWSMCRFIRMSGFEGMCVCLEGAEIPGHTSRYYTCIGAANSVPPQSPTKDNQTHALASRDVHKTDRGINFIASMSIFLVDECERCESKEGNPPQKHPRLHNSLSKLFLPASAYFKGKKGDSFELCTDCSKIVCANCAFIWVGVF